MAVTPASLTPAQHWASDYACRLQSLLEHGKIDEFISAQHAQMEGAKYVFKFIRSWIVLPYVLNQIHARVIVLSKTKRFVLTTVCFLGACWPIGPDIWALTFYVVLNLVTVFASDL